MSDEYDRGAQDAFHYIHNLIRTAIANNYHGRLSADGFITVVEAIAEDHDRFHTMEDNAGRYYAMKDAEARILSHLMRHESNEDVRRQLQRALEAAEYVGD